MEKEFMCDEPGSGKEDNVQENYAIKEVVKSTPPLLIPVRGRRRGYWRAT